MSNAQSESLVDTAAKVTKSVVAIGLFTPLESRAPKILGSGFIAGGGKYVITNHHVVEQMLDPTFVQYYVALHGYAKDVRQFKLEVDAIDPKHDIAILRVTEPWQTESLSLRTGEKLSPPGTEVAITGYPIGAVLGLYAATHRGIVATVAPDIIPRQSVDSRSVTDLERLKSPSLIYQLDLTAYPGNSGSPLYLAETGEVIGILNKVLLSSTRESALTNPSGISYAIPVQRIMDLAKENDIEL
ncbi:S1 family peptidase [Aestuariibacter salexigens]|uniref:S1 family peptidase n=1 Tax=Aestuariibacter salexigens TaxID=226010 RepID=UPI001F0AED14|nr:serine protease [Aestuariibacter salexigens]